MLILRRYTTYLDNRWPLTADHHSWFAFAVSVLLLPWWILNCNYCFCFCRECLEFAESNLNLLFRIVFCRDELYFAVTNCILPWWIVFCRDKLYFAVMNCVLPWQLWATVLMHDVTVSTWVLECFDFILFINSTLKQSTVKRKNPTSSVCNRVEHFLGS